MSCEVSGLSGKVEAGPEDSEIQGNIQCLGSSGDDESPYPKGYLSVNRYGNNGDS